MSPPFRCTVDSHTRGEDLAGSASTVRAFVLVEWPPPWGVDALRDCTLPEQVTSPLLRRCHQNRVRPLLIRRHGRAPATPGRVLVSYAHPGGAWAESTTVADPYELLDLDVAALGRGTSPGLAPHPDPLFLVCTHGRHDVCCAERGRPVAAALARDHPEHTWEVSHIGGDRFSGNVLVLPQGLYYGRLDPASAALVGKRVLAGELDLEHLRGRSCLPFAVQAAEVALRRHLDCRTEGAVMPVSHSRADEVTTARFTREGRVWQVVVRTTMEPAHRLTCRALRDNPSPRHEVLAVEPG